MKVVAFTICLLLTEILFVNAFTFSILPYSRIPVLPVRLSRSPNDEFLPQNNQTNTTLDFHTYLRMEEWKQFSAQLQLRSRATDTDFEADE
jgi:hypothetical protein